MKRFALSLMFVAFSLIAISWFAGNAPASDRTQLAQINIGALMTNAHDLTDTTPAVPY
jgi:hypothetical protein